MHSAEVIAAMNDGSSKAWSIDKRKDAIAALLKGSSRDHADLIRNYIQTLQAEIDAEISASETKFHNTNILQQPH
jgi:hypothetical protein